jgi:hypothetical protein
MEYAADRKDEERGNMMKNSETDINYSRLTTPRAAAVAGILFAVLFSASLILLRSAIPEDPSAGTQWIKDGASRITIALELVPFAGIAFLWFIGVVRDRLGRNEDQFFSTVFFGSGLLFLAMVFVSMAVAGAIVTGYRLNPGITLDSRVIYFGRTLMVQLSNIFALRMAGVFMFSLDTLWLRTRVMPRWLVILTYVLAVSLLLIINFSFWSTLIFPVWVIIISVESLVLNLRRLS